jgi:hypothetical protein
MITQTIDYKDGDTLLEGYVTYDDSIKGPRPAVLVAHDWSGRRDYATSKADEVARMGYVGFALDMYGKGVFGSDGDVELNSSLMGPLAADRAKLRTRMMASVVCACWSSLGPELMWVVLSVFTAFSHPVTWLTRLSALRYCACMVMMTRWYRLSRCWRSSRKCPLPAPIGRCIPMAARCMRLPIRVPITRALVRCTILTLIGEHRAR